MSTAVHPALEEVHRPGARRCRNPGGERSQRGRGHAQDHQVVEEPQVHEEVVKGPGRGQLGEAVGGVRRGGAELGGERHDKEHRDCKEGPGHQERHPDPAPSVPQKPSSAARVEQVRRKEPRNRKEDGQIEHADEDDRPVGEHVGLRVPVRPFEEDDGHVADRGVTSDGEQHHGCTQPVEGVVPREARLLPCSGHQWPTP